ncbi:MAG: type II secretion system protein GspG [Elusimicrobia bacterium]|nr:type II secretion system protein GspG [Elusimicrobiota bacterium]
MEALPDRAASVSPAPPRWKGPYIKKRGALNDPWGRAYVYRARRATKATTISRRPAPTARRTRPTTSPIERR